MKAPMKRSLAVLLLCLFATFFGRLADAEARSAPLAASWTAPSAEASPIAAAAKSDLDDDLPPDVRARLSPAELRDVLVARQHPVTEVAVPVAFFLLILLIVAASLYAGYRKDVERHHTLRQAIDRGASIPSELLVPARTPNADLRRGIVLVALGLALGILLVAMTGLSNGTIALIPLFLGIAYLIVHHLDAKSRQTRPNDASSVSVL